MAIPDFQTLMLPILKLLSKNNIIKLSEMVDIMSDEYNLSEEERNEWLPSKVQKTMYNRVAWAKQYLKNSELIESPEKGSFKITQKGLDILKKKPTRIDLRFLRNLDNKNNINNIEKDNFQINEKTPEELIESAQVVYFESLQKELLSRLKKIDPVRFERIVIDLMEKMNYGIGSMTPLSHDGGIDGIIDEDELGLEKIYLQAKRYADNKVNEKEMQNFVGALGCKPAKKGVFITTSDFSEKAMSAAQASSLGGKIIKLINGEELTKLMIKHCVGIQIKKTIQIKKLDEDYFNDEDNKNMIDRLKKYGINMDYTSGEEVVADENFNGKTFVLTGTLNQITRDKASEIIENKGGKVTSSVTKKTSVVVVGDNPGSKYDKAVSLNIEIWNEEKFMDLIKED